MVRVNPRNRSFTVLPTPAQLDHQRSNCAIWSLKNDKVLMIGGWDKTIRKELATTAYFEFETGVWKVAKP